jgi:hypothetical protein
MTDFDIGAVDLRAVNSMTKYPSIPTYHTLDPRNGGLIEEAVPFTGTVVGTEKVDGTNSRLVMLPDGSYLIGSREELLYARGDLIGNPALGIADALRPVADSLAIPTGDRIVVYFLEVYGGKVTAASKQYTGSGRVGFRLFDVVDIDDHADLLTWDPKRISGWREGGGQRFRDEKALAEAASDAGLEVTPRLFEIDAADLPTGIGDTRAFLDERLPGTLATLDSGAGGRAEGIVLRTTTRSVIAKARFQDYERTLRRRSR